MRRIYISLLVFFSLFVALNSSLCLSAGLELSYVNQVIAEATAGIKHSERNTQSRETASYAAWSLDITKFPVDFFTVSDAHDSCSCGRLLIQTRPLLTLTAVSSFKSAVRIDNSPIMNMLIQLEEKEMSEKVIKDLGSKLNKFCDLQQYTRNITQEPLLLEAHRCVEHENTDDPYQDHYHLEFDLKTVKTDGLDNILGGFLIGLGLKPAVAKIILKSLHEHSKKEWCENCGKPHGLPDEDCVVCHSSAIPRLAPPQRVLRFFVPEVPEPILVFPAVESVGVDQVLLHSLNRLVKPSGMVSAKIKKKKFRRRVGGRKKADTSWRKK